MTHPRWRRRPAAAILLPLALLVALAACGGGDGDGEATVADGTGTGDGAGDGDGTADADRSERPAVPDGDGLALAVTGTIVDGSICPWGQRPCLPIVGSPSTAADDQVRLVGLLDGGEFTVTAELDLMSADRDFSDRCDGLTPAGGGGDDPIDLALVEYQRTIPDSLAIVWVSPSNVFHLGVVDDPEPHRQALAERGIGENVCVVGGFARTERDLRALSDRIRPVVEQWQADGVGDSFGWSPEPFAGNVGLDVYRIDADQRADLEALGDEIEIRAGIEVLDGTLADLDAALDDLVASGPAPRIELTCGPVRFDGVPGDVDDAIGQLSPLDDEAAAALEALADGPAGVEGGSLIDGHDWSIATRTDDELILFGRANGDGPAWSEAGFAQITFARVGDAWAPQGFGGCNLAVEAPGLGPASVNLDPDRQPDPDSTELPVVIQERACASGEAPVDREIVPVVTETATTVEIVVLVAPVKGGANCPGNPWHPITVTLDAPLGDRTVLDGSVQPPEPRTWPPGPAGLDG